MVKRIIGCVGKRLIGCVVKRGLCVSSCNRTFQDRSSELRLETSIRVSAMGLQLALGLGSVLEVYQRRHGAPKPGFGLG